MCVCVASFGEKRRNFFFVLCRNDMSFVASVEKELKALVDSCQVMQIYQHPCFYTLRT